MANYVGSIFFSPLSFFTSFFGMNVSEWSGAQTNANLYYILKITLSFSFILIVIALLAAFSRLTSKVAKRIFEALKSWGELAFYLCALQVSALTVWANTVLRG